MSAAPELAACPFCGGEAILYKHVRAVCNSCDILMSTNAWNRRASILPALRAVRDAMETVSAMRGRSRGDPVAEAATEGVIQQWGWDYLDDDKLLELAGVPGAMSPDQATFSGAAPANSPPREDELCIWCGKTYWQHLRFRPAGGMVPRMPCLGLREGFTSKQPSKPGERCQNCGNNYLTVYSIPDSVWARISPRRAPGGLLCPACADNLSRDAGIELTWRGEQAAEPGERSCPVPSQCIDGPKPHTHNFGVEPAESFMGTWKEIAVVMEEYTRLGKREGFEEAASIARNSMERSDVDGWRWGCWEVAKRLEAKAKEHE